MADTILVVIEQREGKLNSVSLETLAGAQKISAQTEWVVEAAVLGSDVLRDLELVLAHCELKNETKVVIITGCNKAFAAGADITSMAKASVKSAYELTDLNMRAQERLADLPKPTIAAISGFALGAGCEIALCCDFRIAAENAIFGLPEINLGIIPGGGGTQRLPRLVNLSASSRLILLGEKIDAAETFRLGLVDKIVAADRMEEEAAAALAQKLMEKPQLALRAAKAAIRNGATMSLKDGLRMEQDLFCMLFGTQDQKEGMAAFIENRKAAFSGA